MAGHLEDRQYQLPLSAPQRDPEPTTAACTRHRPVEGAEERFEVPGNAVDCPVGCRGTAACLCGQGELSDDPVWIEND